MSAEAGRAGGTSTRSPVVHRQGVSTEAGAAGDISYETGLQYLSAAEKQLREVEDLLRLTEQEPPVAASAVDPAKRDTLCAMGFPTSDVDIALQLCENNTVRQGF